jgi:hypothetical protein
MLYMASLLERKEVMMALENRYSDQLLEAELHSHLNKMNQLTGESL